MALTPSGKTLYTQRNPVGLSSVAGNRTAGRVWATGKAQGAGQSWGPTPGGTGAVAGGRVERSCSPIPRRDVTGNKKTQTPC